VLCLPLANGGRPLTLSLDCEISNFQFVCSPCPAPNPSHLSFCTGVLQLDQINPLSVLFLSHSSARFMLLRFISAARQPRNRSRKLDRTASPLPSALATSASATLFTSSAFSISSASPTSFSNRYTPGLEPVVTYSKQTTEVLPIRYKIGGGGGGTIRPASCFLAGPLSPLQPSFPLLASLPPCFLVSFSLKPKITISLLLPSHAQRYSALGRRILPTDSSGGT